MIAVTRNPVRDFYGKILGWVESDKLDNQQARDFYGKILGTYDKATNTTRDFYGRNLGRGNLLMGLIYKDSK